MTSRRHQHKYTVNVIDVGVPISYTVQRHKGQYTTIYPVRMATLIGNPAYIGTYLCYASGISQESVSQYIIINNLPSKEYLVGKLLHLTFSQHLFIDA